MHFDPVLLSRIQFAFTIAFHILFPTLNIGLGIFIALMEWRWLATNKLIYLQITKFWTKLFALTFGMGVVSGIVLSYELGTNFGPFIHKVGGVLGPLFGYEVMSAFFLEAGFLGVMLFGWKRVGPKLHFFATLMVAIGTLISAFWIMSANSWMQTPAGYAIKDGIIVVTSWWHVIFNPSVLPRFTHMILASLVTTCFVIAAVNAWFLLHKRHITMAQKVLRYCVLALAILVPVQIFVGDMVGLDVHKYQPIKTAAMEANWHTVKGAPLVLFGWPNEKTESNDYALTIPKLASLVNTHQWNGTLQGLTSVAPDLRPPVDIVFISFRLMVGIGLLMLLLGWYGTYLVARGKLFNQRWLLRILTWTAPLGVFATWAGWVTAEVGRQPYIAYHLVTTTEGASHLSMHQVLSSLLIFVVFYVTIFIFYLNYLLKTISKGPTELDDLPNTVGYLVESFKHEAEKHTNKRGKS